MDKSALPLVYLIILNYCGYEDTCECIDSIREINYDNSRILIVDNDSQDGSYDKLLKQYPTIEIIQTGKNLGYAGGNNVGIKYALNKKAEYVGILNNDIGVEKNFLSRIIAKMEENHKIGIAGPAICEWDSDIIQSCGASINYMTSESKCFMAGEDYKKISKEDREGDYVGGACLIVRREVFDKISLLPENYFLFFEETEFCVRAKKYGYLVCGIPEARIWHKESASVNKNSELKTYLLDRNKIIFEKRNAPKYMYTIFLCYTFIQTIFRMITKKNPTSGIKTIFDGVWGKMQYKDLHIKE